jgi:glycosyltransferase involved in cell wall biosynthesis
MAAGLPVATTRACGAAEVITDGLSGFVVADPDDAAAFAAALDGVLGDPAARAAMGAAARAAAAASWDWVAAQTEAVYADLLAERAGG